MKRAELKEVIRQAMLKEVGTLSKVTGPSGTSAAQVVSPADKANLEKAGAKVTTMEGNVTEDRFMDAALEDLERVVKNIAHTAGISLDEAAELAANHIQDMFSEELNEAPYSMTDMFNEELNEAPYSMTNKVLPEDYDRITGKINSGLVEMGHWLEQNYEGNALPELQSIQDAYTEFDNKIAHGADEEYEGGDLGTPGDNALGLEEAVKRADALIAEYRK